MREEYEQMELDTRTALDAALENLVNNAITSAFQMIKDYHRHAAIKTQTAPPFVRNRHEAYGIAAEQMVKINAAVKAIKSDTDRLLGTLADPTSNAPPQQPKS